ncbi:MAG: glycosyltransferase family 4 protein [Phycisphaerales bacterium]|nr:glycosyltransferase family 4 protein [Phycisphaerales bacterium]
MNILTTTMCYPTPDHPDRGIFVQRRAAALPVQDITDEPYADPIHLRVVAPQPWCPGLRHNTNPAAQNHPLPTDYPRMFSIPVLGWATDGLAYGWALRRYIEGMPEPIDLIDAHFEYPDGVGAWLAARRLGLPVVVTVRGKIVSLSKRTIRRRQIAAMLRGVDARISVSESLMNWIHRVAGSDLEVDLIPNGIDSDTFHLMDREQARTALGWNPANRYLLSVGHLQWLKGFDRLVEALPAVRAARGNVRLVLAGSLRGERRFCRQVKAMIDQCNALSIRDTGNPCVEFTGPVTADQLNLMYNAADAMVLASRSEGCSNAIAEALAAGTPVVATDVGGNYEQVCSRELGILVPDGDSFALSRAMGQVLDQAWNRPLISAHGVARGWRHVADEVRSVFNRVLQHRRAWIANAILGASSAMSYRYASEREQTPAARTEVGP